VYLSVTAVVKAHLDYGIPFLLSIVSVPFVTLIFGNLIVEFFQQKDIKRWVKKRVKPII
jgi:hypothetical protein